ncbi:Two component regulator three Y domain-containing protein [Bacillus massiliglaciei]|uniref:Two component regulator three Y domain-containing protein n=1 Tax=Bacillus massiliglaciei TaxID=1816693 RepID=UPI000ADB86A0|nr:Two component regulator three Y domain-containing protein [Bacillus massiliglaciei]
MFKGEKVYIGEREVKYLFQKSYKPTNSLVIIFSAFPTKGKKPSYNFVRTLAEFDCNKLFILDDFGSRASYYLCEKRDFSIERSVISLISKIAEENEIKTFISCGSSKGGYSALYYGIKYGFDHIIAASPQYYLGDYLLEQTNSEDVTHFMSGASHEEDHLFLNEIMSRMISATRNKPDIFIHLGDREPHYENHVKPLLSLLDTRDMRYQLDLGSYSQHSDVAKFFPDILKGKIRELLHYPLLKVTQTVEGEAGKGAECTFHAETDSASNQIAWYLYHDKKRIQMINYSLNKSFSAKLEQAGTYQAKAFTINEKNNKVSCVSKAILVKRNR